MSSLIIATGSNLGDKLDNLQKAQSELTLLFKLEAQSRIYHSKAVDYQDQPSFYNQVLQYKLPQNLSAHDVLNHLLEIENKLGRTREVHKGPRLIDIDLLFYALEHHETSTLLLPHPRLWERSFVVLPLKELPFFKTLEKNFNFSNQFEVSAQPLSAQNQMSHFS